MLYSALKLLEVEVAQHPHFFTFTSLSLSRTACARISSENSHILPQKLLLMFGKVMSGSSSSV
jgi:hypothetical protein